jgi:hypothetical protein
MRKVWLLTLACLILLCCGCGKEPAETTVPITDASAATQDASPDLGLEYEIFDGQVRILGVTRGEAEIVIPENIEGLPVTAIGEEAFYQNPCRSVTLPDTLRTIEAGAFYRCYYLEEIRIPAAVTEIGSGAFFRTSSLRNIWVAEGNTAYCDLDGVLLSGDKTTLIHYPEGRAEATYTISKTVSAIGETAFGYCPAVQLLVIPATVTGFPDTPFAAITDGVTILAEPGSAAEQYAVAQNISLNTIDPAYITILNDYRTMVKFRLSEEFETDYNGDEIPELSQTLQQCIDTAEPYKWGDMWVEMTSGINTPTEASFGYILQDLNGDGTAEMIWLRQDRTLLALFTIQNDAPVLVDAFWPKHDGYITEQGYLFTAGSGGVATDYQVRTMDGKPIAQFRRDAEIFFETVDGKEQSIDPARFEALLQQYPTEHSGAFAALPIIPLDNGVIPAFLIGRDGGNRISVQMPPSNEINEDESLLVEDYIRKTLRETTGMDLCLIRSETGITDTERDYTGYCMLLESRVICRTKDLVSIAFEGILDQKDAAHPVSLFLILNYNPETLTQVHFYDLYVVDESLYQVFAEKAENELLQELGGQWPDGWRGFAEEICSKEQFMKGLQNESDYAWYLTEIGVVISYPVPHALGDQRQVELPYSALTPRNTP